MFLKTKHQTFIQLWAFPLSFFLLTVAVATRYSAWWISRCILSFDEILSNNGRLHLHLINHWRFSFEYTLFSISLSLSCAMPSRGELPLFTTATFLVDFSFSHLFLTKIAEKFTIIIAFPPFWSGLGLRSCTWA